MKMRNLFAVVLLAAVSLTGCMSKVPAGNVGIEYHMLGSSKGVDIEERGPGRYWLGWNDEMFLFPTFTQNYTWQKPQNDGDPDEELGFQTQDGMVVTADMGISYHIQPDKADEVFRKYRRGINEITDTFLRNYVRDALVREASKMSVESVYGVGKTALLDAVQKDVSDKVAPLGIIVEKVYWIGELRLPQNVIDAINAKVKATQYAQQKQNEVAQAQADALKAIAEAHGTAQSRLEIANAEAQAIEVKGRALDNNPKLIDYVYAQNWKGGCTTFCGDNGGKPVPVYNVNK